MKKKYFILAFTFLCLLMGQSSYSQDWEDMGFDDETTDFLNDYEDQGGEIDVYDNWGDYTDVVNNDDDPYNDWEYIDYIDPDLVGTTQNYNYDANTGITTWEEYTHSQGWSPVDYSGSNDAQDWEDQYGDLINPYEYYEAPDQEDDQYPDDDTLNSNGPTPPLDPTNTPNDKTISNPCVKAIEDDLKKLAQGKFGEILNKFSAPNSIYKVNISVGSLGGSSSLAQITNVIPYVRGSYDITLNENYQNVTSLSIATTLVHEYIHAYFKTMFDDYFNNHNTHAYDDFPTLKEVYLDPNRKDEREDAQHKQMAASYIDLMAAIIQEFQTGTAVAVGQADPFYKDMAWSSFEGTPVYNKLSQTDIDRIHAVRAAEVTNTEREGNTPKGKPCEN